MVSPASGNTPRLCHKCVRVTRGSRSVKRANLEAKCSHPSRKVFCRANTVPIRFQWVKDTGYFIYGFRCLRHSGADVQRSTKCVPLKRLHASAVKVDDSACHLLSRCVSVVPHASTAGPISDCREPCARPSLAKKLQAHGVVAFCTALLTALMVPSILSNRAARKLPNPVGG